MKEVWFFLIHLFEGGERHDKKMRRLRTPGEYEAVEASIFQELPLREPRGRGLRVRTASPKSGKEAEEYSSASFPADFRRRSDSVPPRR